MIQQEQQIDLLLNRNKEITLSEKSIEIKYKVFRIIFIHRFQTKKNMYKDSYNQRLKEIRQKYGVAVKDTTSCLKSNNKFPLKLDSKYDENYTDKYTINKKLFDPSERQTLQNFNPTLNSFQNKYSSSILSKNDTAKNNDSFLHTQTKDERLKEIEQIRKEFAQSRNKAVDDFNRTVQRSKSKIMEPQRYDVLRQRVNTITTNYNPEDFRTKSKEPQNKQRYRSRAQSSCPGIRGEPDFQLNDQLKRKYDYNYDYETSAKNIMDLDPKSLSSFRKNSLSRFERQNGTSSIKKDFNLRDNFRSMKQIDSETTSPIRGLMKFDSLEKSKKTEIGDTFLSANKLGSNSYDLTNIDKIQDRIHRILAKK